MSLFTSEKIRVICVQLLPEVIKNLQKNLAKTAAAPFGFGYDIAHRQRKEGRTGRSGGFF